MMFMRSAYGNHFCRCNFCNILQSIKKEITTCSSILKNAPHTQQFVINKNWEENYSREDAVFPNEKVRENKFWPSVRRIDEAHGDRNLICSCKTMEEYLV